MARYEWFGPYDSEGEARVIELSPRRFVTRPRIAGVILGELRHDWSDSPQGATYTAAAIAADIKARYEAPLAEVFG